MLAARDLEVAVHLLRRKVALGHLDELIVGAGFDAQDGTVHGDVADGGLHALDHQRHVTARLDQPVLARTRPGVEPQVTAWGVLIPDRHAQWTAFGAGVHRQCRDVRFSQELFSVILGKGHGPTLPRPATSRPSRISGLPPKVGNMRFGLFIPQGWRLDLVGIEPADQWQVMRDLATYVDDGGVWDSLWVYDHFHTVPMPTNEATHEAWSLMAAYAATTSRIKLGQMCTAMSYRNPVYLAKVAATADIISGGRIQMGIGGGWYEHEWRAYGYGFPSAGVRLARLDEGVQIMRDAWRDGVVTFDGKHYQVDGAIVPPKPLQDGGIPLWIAGGGEKVTLRIAAKYAQYTNFTSEPEGFAHKSQVLADHCRARGYRFRGDRPLGEHQCRGRRVGGRGQGPAVPSAGPESARSPAMPPPTPC